MKCTHACWQWDEDEDYVERKYYYGWLRAPRHMKSFKQHFQLFTQQTFENHTSSITQRNMKKFDTKVQTKTNFHFSPYAVVVVYYQYSTISDDRACMYKC